jgi:uncharacterized protein YodC (DUF2158 family)
MAPTKKRPGGRRCKWFNRISEESEEKTNRYGKEQRKDSILKDGTDLKRK